MIAILCNGQHPEWGCASIPLPIPDDEYGHCIDLLEQLQIGGVTANDCYLDQLNEAPPVLAVLEQQTVNIDELDFLARSMDRYTDEEMAKFQSAAAARDYRDLPTLINLSFCCESTTVITDFTDLESIGKRHYLDVHGGATTEEYKALNGVVIAHALINSGEGIVTPYGVLYENGMQLVSVYAGQSFPIYNDKAYLLEMELEASPAMPEDAPPTVLFLPMPEKRLERLLERSGCLTAEDVHIHSWCSELPEQINGCLNVPHESVTELNRMLQAIGKLNNPDWDRLAAAVLMAQPECAMQVRHLAENLDLFDFIPNIKTPEDYGRFMIQQSGHFEFDENLADFYDYAKYGEQRVARESGEFNELGYISYHGTLSLDELMMEDPAEQYRGEETEEQGQMMGGLT